MSTAACFRNIRAADAPHQVLPKIRPLHRRIRFQVAGNPANAELVEQVIARRMDLKLLMASKGRQGIEIACC